MRNVTGQAATVPVEQRRTQRDLVDFGAQLIGRAAVYDFRIVNISPLGLMGRIQGEFRPGDEVLVELPHVRLVEAEVRWAEDGRLGLEFMRPIPADHYRMMLTFMPQRKIW
jgi:hypothetical protein